MANVITVTALNRYVKTLLESDAVLTDIAVRGEIQNFVNHYKSGHFYFSLKDETGSVKAVMFRSYASRLSFVPENGMSVVVRGRISLYERDGAFQIYVEELFPDGIGAAQIAFEQLKARLANEGLFAPEAKKALPAWPRRIGLVTSKTGAAIRDIWSVAQRRWPLADFLVYDATVQGKEAEAALVSGVTKLDKSGLTDVIIVARGGGSREDLWVFNSEALARAVFNCRTPVVSGVGHEIDFTILDFVADLRAATPTAAAELVLPDRQALNKQLFVYAGSMRNAVSKRYEMCYNTYMSLCADSLRHAPDRRLAEDKVHLASLGENLTRAAAQRLESARTRAGNCAAVLDSLSPLKTLGRGYCIARDDSGSVVRARAQVAAGDSLGIEFKDFTAVCTVDALKDKGR